MRTKKKSAFDVLSEALADHGEEIPAGWMSISDMLHKLTVPRSTLRFKLADRPSKLFRVRNGGTMRSIRYYDMT